MIQATYVDHMGSDLTVVNAARVSFGKRSEALTDRDKKLIRYLATHKHMSPFEHCTLTVSIDAPLFIRAQVMRHRTFAYNEVSRRYTSEELRFYSPRVYRLQGGTSRQGSEGVLVDSDPWIDAADRFHRDAFVLYRRMISAGICREQARGILPQNLMTSFYMTGNLRNWAHFIDLRTHEGAQEEVRGLAAQIQCILLLYFPFSAEALLGGGKK